MRRGPCTARSRWHRQKQTSKQFAGCFVVEATSCACIQLSAIASVGASSLAGGNSLVVARRCSCVSRAAIAIVWVVALAQNSARVLLSVE